MTWKEEIVKIVLPDAAWAEKARLRLHEQTRPQGSLGLLEGILERLSAIQKKERLDISRKRILIFAADHGVAQEGVSLYPREVTAAMVMNFLNGGATINALARQIGADVKVIDVGVDADFSTVPGTAGTGSENLSRNVPGTVIVDRKIARGTKNIAREAAMSRDELDQAFNTGWNMAEEAHREGIQILGLGEMGIANTTAASAVIAALTGESAEMVTGRGTGLDETARRHKVQVIDNAIRYHWQSLSDPLTVLQCLGGFEIAAMTGALLGAARFGIPVMVDGWIVSASALAALELNAKCLDYLFFAHESAEQGHRILLKHFDVRPMLDLSMRLGEASGAALALSILDSAVRIYNEVATFAEAGVAKRVR